MPAPAVFAFDNTFARKLEGFYVPWQPAAAPAPRLLHFDRALADELCLRVGDLDEGALGSLFAGNTVPEGAYPIAQVYAGHQFGGFSPRLGDGRALLLGEVIDRKGRRRDIAMKGSGRTPFARNGDGKAAVGPMLREVLVGEAMHALGIPTTRALAVAATGDTVQRERPLPGAVLTRVAASHLRVGTFQYFASLGIGEDVRKLLDYTVARHDPALARSENPALGLLEAVVARQAALIAQWMNAGFIHGVMNTDNMTISGETIDYGPCAFMEAFDPAAVFSSIDQHGRYAYRNQPEIALWNLTRLAESLLPLIDEAEEKSVALATEVLNTFPKQYRAHLLRGQRAKLGLARDEADDAALAEAWLALLHAEKVDYTLAWRRLADAAAGDEATLRGLFANAQAPDAWLGRWKARCGREEAGGADRAKAMRQANPFVIPRNHRVEEALSAAQDAGDLVPFEKLLAALRRPFDEDGEQAPYGEPAPVEVTACYRTFCGT
ncbi:MAG: YdiU family protein [Betaproteobacteria bacterium]|nr:YdiU family protein [Betaproteobacteria bacterium]